MFVARSDSSSRLLDDFARGARTFDSHFAEFFETLGNATRLPSYHAYQVIYSIRFKSYYAIGRAAYRPTAPFRTPNRCLAGRVKFSTPNHA